jgi:hypothetical protein
MVEKHIFLNEILKQVCAQKLSSTFFQGVFAWEKLVTGCFVSRVGRDEESIPVYISQQ